jgi:hypothetical protein
MVGMGIVPESVHDQKVVIESVESKYFRSMAVMLKISRITTQAT